MFSESDLTPSFGRNLIRNGKRIYDMFHTKVKKSDLANFGRVLYWNEKSGNDIHVFYALYRNQFEDSGFQDSSTIKVSAH